MISQKDQLELKIALENIFKKDVRRIFSGVLNDFRVTVASNGTQQAVNKYNPKWQSSLETHYSRVQNKFKKAAIPNKKQDDNDDEELLLLALLLWRDQQSQTHANLINETTRKNMIEALRVARLDFDERGEVPTNRELSLAATAILRRKFAGRVDSIAITETQAAAESTKFISAEVESGNEPSVIAGFVAQSKTTKMWKTMGDSKVRGIHRAAAGQVRKMNEPFNVGGELLMFPGDGSLGASAKNTANCLHPSSIVNFSSPKKLYKRWYDGQMITVKTHGGHKFTVTPNHPILGIHGWIGSKFLKKGDSIIGCKLTDIDTFNLDVQNAKSSIEQVFNLFSTSIGFMRSSRIVVDFHGDITNKDVNVIRFNRSLLNSGIFTFYDPFKKFKFPFSNLRHRFMSCFSSFCECMFVINRFCISNFNKFLSCFFCLFRPLNSSHFRPFKNFSFALSSWFNSINNQYFIDRTSRKAGFFRDFINRHSSLKKRYDFIKSIFMSFFKFKFLRFGISPSYSIQNTIQPSLSDIKSLFKFRWGRSFKVESFDIVDINHFYYSGYVYNLEDDKSYYICNGIAMHNCRCSSRYLF